ncbi:unnamed protein product, partial [Mesorhabditis belari]|uniref:Uncharacterized protein n=1 Tax=Mesorhabditis belari TaxID=2138241 RepID=A0AAF3FIU2_9BILA
MDSPYRPSVFIPREAKNLSAHEYTILKPLSDKCRKCRSGTQFVYSPIARRKSGQLQAIGRFSCLKMMCIQTTSGRLIEIFSTKNKEVHIVPIGQCSANQCSISLALDGPAESNHIKLSPFLIASSSLPTNFVPLPIRGFSCGGCDEEIAFCVNEEMSERADEESFSFEESRDQSR